MMRLGPARNVGGDATRWPAACAASLPHASGSQARISKANPNWFLDLRDVRAGDGCANQALAAWKNHQEK